MYRTPGSPQVAQNWPEVPKSGIFPSEQSSSTVPQLLSLSALHVSVKSKHQEKSIVAFIGMI